MSSTPYNQLANIMIHKNIYVHEQDQTSFKYIQC